MNGAPRVGIVGGHGAVGRSAARQLRTWCRLRIGGRDAGSGRALVDSLSGGAEWQTVDAQDARSLASFCAGCTVVANCAGPAGSIGDTIARAAFAAGADYVDAGGHADWRLPAHRRTAVLAAGMYPGLSGLLPRFLAELDGCRMTGLTAYIGGCDRLSTIAALDYLNSLRDGFGKANAAWLGGKPVSQALSGGERTSVPFFPRPVVLQPYLTAEAERLAMSLGLSDLRWYSVFDGEHVLAALPVAASRRDAEALVKAAHLDLFGREPYQLMLFEMAGTRAGTPAWRSLMVKASSGADLTGHAMAAAVRAIVAGEIPDGVHCFAEVMDPTKSVDELRRADAVQALEVFDEPLTWSEQGEI